MRGDVRKEMRGGKEVYFMDEFYEGEGLTDQQGGFVRASGELEDTWTTLYQTGQEHTHWHHIKHIHHRGCFISIYQGRFSACSSRGQAARKADDKPGRLRC
jgi:hypothetical protein